MPGPRRARRERRLGSLRAPGPAGAAFWPQLSNTVTNEQFRSGHARRGPEGTGRTEGAPHVGVPDSPTGLGGLPFSGGGADWTAATSTATRKD